MRQLLDLLIELVVLRHEQLAERAGIDEAQESTLRERDDDVRMLRCLLARALRPQQLSRHPEMHDNGLGTVEPQHEVLAAPLHSSHFAAFELRREFLLVAVAANRPQSRHLDRLDLLADDFPVEVAAYHLDLR